MQIYFEMIKQLSDEEEVLKTFSRNGEIRRLADARASSYQSKQNTSLLARITLYIYDYKWLGFITLSLFAVF